jgi:CHAT domain-containing protein/Tfp pilus assembly protein PilF
MAIRRGSSFVSQLDALAMSFGFVSQSTRNFRRTGVFCIVAFALALVVSGPAFAGDAEWKAHVDAGTSAYRAGDYRAAIARYEAALKEAQAFVESDPRLTGTLNNLAELYREQGRYEGAELLFRRSLEIREKVLGPDHPEVALALHNLAGLYLKQGRYSEAEPLYRRSLGIFEKNLGPNHPDVARSLNNLAELYREQGRYTEAEPLYRRSLAIREKALGLDHPDVGTGLNNLALLHFMQGHYAEAEPLMQRSLVIAEKALGPDHPFVATSVNNLAKLYEAQGRFTEAEQLFRRSLAMLEKALGPDHPQVGGALNNLAELYREQGRFAEAETLYRRSLGIVEKALGSDHPEIALALHNIASLYQTQGRYAEAEPLIQRSLVIAEKALGPDHMRVGATLNILGMLFVAQGRYTEAEPLFRRSLAIQEKALGPDHPQVSGSLNNLAMLYQFQGRIAEAEPQTRRALGIAEKTFGPDHPTVGTILGNLARLYAMQGRYAEAEPLYRRSLAIFEKTLSSNHPDIGRTLNNLAELYRAQGKLNEALTLTRRANALFAQRFTTDSGTSRRGALGEQRNRSGDFEFQVSLLATVSEREPKMRAEVMREGFGVAQLARASDTAEQVAKMAARYAAGSDALAQLARVRQDAMAKFEQLDSRIVQAAGQRGNETITTKLRDEQADTMKTITELDMRLEREYPQYGELTNPKPLELAAAQKLLAEDEALVLLLASADESFLWVLRRNDAGFFKLGIKRSELADIVKKLRSQLDLDVPDPERLLGQPFNVALAHELYRKIFAPAEALFVGAKHLIFVPDGAMQSLPPGVLVTELPAKPVAGLADLAQVAWLAKKYTITVLPAAGSLRALRQFAKAPASREPFSGYGDPVLGGSSKDARKGNVAALYSRGAVADVNEVRNLARLPESAGELRAIAVALNAPATSISLGSAATERAVKEADLTRYRNLAFATHGLMAGDFKGLAEPALVLTPPEKGSELDDGLLTAGEISQLKLDADWVVLSACNTAAPDGTPGAEGLSGLARAFFYAGARSLLVSHWAVSSDAAVALTTRMFDETAKGASKAEALRRSMLALMVRTDNPYFAHPAFWAPFVVVGEGNAQWTGGR